MKGSIGSESREGGGRRAGLPADLDLAVGELHARRPDLGFDIRWAASVVTTMDEVARAAEAGAPAGLVIVADQQTAGRGRRGHAWSSLPGAGLYFSYLARPRRAIEILTLAAGVAVARGVAEATGLHAHLKWPNDLLVGRRKLAGVLAEASHLATPDAAVVVGVGVNLQAAAYPPDVAARATSLQAELGHAVDRFLLLTAILEQLIDALAALEAGKASGILQAWRAASPSAVGCTVTWFDAGTERGGVTSGIDDSGALLVQTAAGTERVIAGELEWRLPDS